MVRGAGDKKDMINIAMEYVEGGSLASLLHEFGPLPTQVCRMPCLASSIGVAAPRQVYVGHVLRAPERQCAPASLSQAAEEEGHACVGRGWAGGEGGRR